MQNILYRGEDWNLQYCSNILFYLTYYGISSEKLLYYDTENLAVHGPCWVPLNVPLDTIYKFKDFLVHGIFLGIFSDGMFMYSHRAPPHSK